MKFSLINIAAQNGQTIQGSFLQNHIGTLKSAVARARQVEIANGNRITVGVVDELQSSVPGSIYWINLKRIDNPPKSPEESINEATNG